MDMTKTIEALKTIRNQLILERDNLPADSKHDAVAQSLTSAIHAIHSANGWIADAEHAAYCAARKQAGRVN